MILSEIPFIKFYYDNFYCFDLLTEQKFIPVRDNLIKEFGEIYQYVQE